MKKFGKKNNIDPNGSYFEQRMTFKQIKDKLIKKKDTDRGVSKNTKVIGKDDGFIKKNGTDRGVSKNQKMSDEDGNIHRTGDTVNDLLATGYRKFVELLKLPSENKVHPKQENFLCLDIDGSSNHVPVPSTPFLLQLPQEPSC